MSIDAPSRRFEQYASQPTPHDATVSFASVKHQLLREQDAQGIVDWSIDRIKGSKKIALAEANRRTELFRDGERVPIRLSPRMQELMHLFDHTLPFFGADAIWVRDELRHGRHSTPRLFLQVTLHDSDLANTFSVLSFTSNLLPGSDLSELSPVDLDRSVVLYEEFGFNQEGAIYELTPHPLDEVLYGNQGPVTSS